MLCNTRIFLCHLQSGLASSLVQASDLITRGFSVIPCSLSLLLPSYSPTLNGYHNTNFQFRYRSFGELGIPLQWLHSRKLACIIIYKDLLLCSRYFQALCSYFRTNLMRHSFLFPLYREESWSSERVSILVKVKWQLRGKLQARTLSSLTQKLLPTHLSFCSVGSELRISQQTTNWSLLKLTRRCQFIWTYLDNFSLTAWFLLGNNL